MTLLNWIGSNPDAAVAIVTGIGGWIYAKAHGQKTDDLWETLQDLARPAIVELLRDPAVYATARAKLAAAAWEGLGRLRIKRSKAIEKLVNEVVVWAEGQLAEKLMARELAAFTKVQGKTLETLKNLPPPDVTTSPDVTFEPAP